jgi:hypothetical protein
MGASPFFLGFGVKPFSRKSALLYPLKFHKKYFHYLEQVLSLNKVGFGMNWRSQPKPKSLRRREP